jgi:hypothetical protein
MDLRFSFVCHPVSKKIFARNETNYTAVSFLSTDFHDVAPLRPVTILIKAVALPKKYFVKLFFLSFLSKQFLQKNAQHALSS